MKCLMKYQWVKLPRKYLPVGKGILGLWAKLASRAAFRKGYASYCGYRNKVEQGTWVGGVAGIKSMLKLKSRVQAIETLELLRELELISYELDNKTKKLTYRVLDWVVKCSGKECTDGNIYATEGYGFLCLPRSIPDRLVEKNYVFEEADAWIDLWCHSVFQDPNNIFSYQAPIVQFVKYGALLTLETIGKRWKWEKTKVWRFLKKYSQTFSVYRLPGSYGCLIFNKTYADSEKVSLPTSEKIMSILDDIRFLGKNVRKEGSDHCHMNYLTAWYSRRLSNSEIDKKAEEVQVNRVAVLSTIIHAYFSLCRNCKNCIYDCQSKYYSFLTEGEVKRIRDRYGGKDIIYKTNDKGALWI